MTDTKQTGGRALLAEMVAELEICNSPNPVDWADDLGSLLVVAAEQISGGSTSSRGEALVEYIRSVGPDTILAIEAAFVALEAERDALREALAPFERAMLNADIGDHDRYGEVDEQEIERMLMVHQQYGQVVDAGFSIGEVARAARVYRETAPVKVPEHTNV